MAEPTRRGALSPGRCPLAKTHVYRLAGSVGDEVAEEDQAVLEVDGAALNPDHVVAVGRFGEEGVGEALRVAADGVADGGFSGWMGGEPQQASGLSESRAGGHASGREPRAAWAA